MKIYSSASEILATMLQEDNGKYPSQLALDFIRFLLSHGCDYYDIMRILAAQNSEHYSKESIRLFFTLAPENKRLKSFSVNDIHGMIPRWTSTKYHTAPINDILVDIRAKCLSKQAGIFIYNSNMNPNNPKAINDPYILMIVSAGICFLDLNRKKSFKYFYKTGGIFNVDNSNL